MTDTFQPLPDPVETETVSTTRRQRLLLAGLTAAAAGVAALMLGVSVAVSVGAATPSVDWSTGSATGTVVLFDDHTVECAAVGGPDDLNGFSCDWSTFAAPSDAGLLSTGFQDELGLRTGITGPDLLDYIVVATIDGAAVSSVQR